MTPPRIRSLETLPVILQAHRRSAEEWVRERGLTIEQSTVLGYLDQRPGALQRDIAEMSRTTPANVSLMLKTLERRGLVERRTGTGDGRGKSVHATPEGLALVTGLNDAMAEADRAIFAALDADEQAALDSLLDKVCAALPPYRP